MSLIKSHKKSLAPNVQFDIHVVRKIVMSTFVEPLTCAKGGMFFSIISEQLVDWTNPPKVLEI